MKKRFFYIMLIPITISILFTLLNLTGFYKSAEDSVYDILLHFRKGIPENDSLLLVDIDDPSIAQVGVWPWSRDIMADGLILMKEMGTRTAVFDIEYTEQSPLGVNADLLKKEIPETFSAEFETINNNISGLFQAIQEGSIPVKEAGDYINQLTGLNDQTREALLQKVADIARDNDKYLGQAAYFFGNAFFTINMLPGKEGKVSGNYKKYILDNVSLKNIVNKDDGIFTAEDIRPAIAPILKNAKGAGFPNVPIDSDGVMRRINLISRYEKKFFPQLVFGPILEYFGNPQIIADKNSITLNGIKGQNFISMKIPLSADRKLLVNWTKNSFQKSFRHLSYFELVLNKRLEQTLIENLKTIDDAGYLSYYQGDSDLLSIYSYTEGIKKEMLEGGSLSSMEDYISGRDFFFTEVGNFLKGDAEKSLLSDIENVINSPDVQKETREAYADVKKEVPGNFKAIREVYNSLEKSRSMLKEALDGSFAIIGQTGTSTTDIGVTPFEKEFMNVGIHANVANTILNRSFLDNLPWWYSAAAAFILSILITILIKNRKPIPSVIMGFSASVLILAALSAYFITTGVYFPVLTPSLTTFFTVIIIFILSFFTLEKEKSFLRNAFSHYLSTDVINELISNPDKLNLGGEKKELSAIFTDIQGFSSISEKLDPTELVHLLNAYLTAMSDVILDMRGTIDKYEGDAIIAFFGAPVEYPEHAAHACLAAVRMKRIEYELNERFITEQMTPSPLFTRVGINTGPMVVGNMGTPKKMDYTIMGNAVNLASRLEGVNKQYGTGILISEETYKAGGGNFTVRKLDRVRVVGINTPVRLYELIEEKSRTDQQTLEAVEVFHEALDLFEEKKWEKAGEVFSKVLDILPNDGPARTYLERCRDYKKKPPKESWDGVFNLTTK